MFCIDFRKKRSSVPKWLVAGMFLFPCLVYANVVWPALYLEMRIFSWWAITFGVLIEFLFVKWLLVLSAGRAFGVVILANAVSTVAGVVLLPLLGVAWEFFPGALINSAFDWGTFNPITWSVTFVLGCLLNALIEGVVYKKIVSGFRLWGRFFVWLLVANSFSVAAAFISLWVVPIQG